LVPDPVRSNSGPLSSMVAKHLPIQPHTLSTTWKIISAPNSLLGRTLPFLRRASARINGRSVGHLSCNAWARLSGRHSTASAAPLAAEDDGGADDIRAAYPATTAEAPVSSQPAFDERGGMASEAVTNYAADYAPLLNGSAGMRAGRAASARISSPAPSTRPRGAAMAPSSRSIARRSLLNFSSRSCSATKREPSPEPTGGSPGSSSTRTREPSTSTRSPIFPSPSRPSFYMSFRTSVSPASAATG